MKLAKKTIIIGMVSALAVAGCSKSAKPESKKPVPLVAIDKQAVKLTPVFVADLPNASKFSRQDTLHKKDLLALQVASDDTHLFAAATSGAVEGFELGKKLWSVNVGEPIVSGVAYDKFSRVAFVGTRSGRLLALDTETGSVRWEQKLPTITTAPALIAGNRVLVSGNDGLIYGLNLQNGTPIWQFSTQNPAISVRGTAKPLRLDGETALFGMADGRIHALDIDQGKPLWTRRIGVAIGGNDVGRMSDVDGTPLVVGNQLYVTSFSGNFVGFDMSTGRTLFTVRDFASVHPVAYQNGVLAGVDTTGMVHGFNRMGGRVWQNNALKYRKPTASVVFGGFFAVGDLEGFVHLFDKDGNLVARTAIKGKNPIVSLDVQNNRLIAQTNTGEIVAWEL